MKRLLFVSLKGGCGSTTVTANLAQALVKINKQVLAIEMVPNSLLQTHLGLPQEEQEGWAKQFLTEKPWSQAGYKSPQGTFFLPFGHLHAEQLNTFSNHHSHYLSMLGDVTLQVSESNGEQWQLFHANLTELTNSALCSFVDSMDMIIVVMTADALSYLTLQSWMQKEEVSHLHRSGKLRFLVNQYQPETEIGRDFMLVLKKELSESLVPISIHRDTALLECVANLTTVQHYSPSSQAAKDFQSFAFWCVSALSSAQDRR